MKSRKNESVEQGVAPYGAQSAPPVNADVRIIMKKHIAICIAALTITTVTHADTLYSLDFSDFSPPVTYANPTGAPDDFSGYVGTNSTVVSEFQGLTDQPLVSTSTNASSSNRYGLEATGYNNHILTFTLQLVLESLPDPDLGPNAVIGFYSVGQNLYNSSVALSVIFGLTDSYSLATSNVCVDTGFFTANSSFNRDSVISLSISANTAAHLFNVSINDTPLAVDAPYDPLIEIAGATIRIGDIATQGAIGNGAFDNIEFSAQAIPEPSTGVLLILSALGLGAKKAIKRIRTTLKPPVAQGLSGS